MVYEVAGESIYVFWLQQQEAVVILNYHAKDTNTREEQHRFFTTCCGRSTLSRISGSCSSNLHRPFVALCRGWLLPVIGTRQDHINRRLC